MIPILRPLALILALILAACAPAPAAKPPLYPVPASATPDRPRMVTILLPGALTTSEVFGPEWRQGDPGHLVLEYRLPGMQGEPLRPALQIDRAADWVAAQANRHPGARINLLGFSTGAAVAVEAAGRITGPARVRVALVSPATPFPGAALAAVRGGLQVAGTALVTGTLSARRLWEEYFVTLLLGPGWRRSPELAARGEAFLERWRNRIIIPGDNRGRAQSASLLTWTLSPAARHPGMPVLILHGGRDAIFPPDEARRLAGALGATLCIYPDGGHLLYLTHADANRRLRAFLLTDSPDLPCKRPPE